MRVVLAVFALSCALCSVAVAAVFPSTPQHGKFVKGIVTVEGFTEIKPRKIDTSIPAQGNTLSDVWANGFSCDKVVIIMRKAGGDPNSLTWTVGRSTAAPGRCTFSIAWVPPGPCDLIVGYGTPHQGWLMGKRVVWGSTDEAPQESITFTFRKIDIEIKEGKVMASDDWSK